jgi:hypothetical protein
MKVYGERRHSSTILDLDRVVSRGPSDKRIWAGIFEKYGFTCIGGFWDLGADVLGYGPIGGCGALKETAPAPPHIVNTMSELWTHVSVW